MIKLFITEGKPFKKNQNPKRKHRKRSKFSVFLVCVVLLFFLLFIILPHKNLSIDPRKKKQFQRTKTRKRDIRMSPKTKEKKETYKLCVEFVRIL